MTAITLPINGMTCASCVSRVERALNAIPGASKVQVNLASDTAYLELDDTSQLSAVSAALDQAGYQLGTEAKQLSIEGMSCAGCVRRVETALLAVPGVLGAEVNLASQQARVM